jgi:hypothetical protein
VASVVKSRLLARYGELEAAAAKPANATAVKVAAAVKASAAKPKAKRPRTVGYEGGLAVEGTPITRL